jgi:gas vesicle protein
MNNPSKMIIALTAGVAIGTLAGFLFAPDKGEATRKNIGRQAGKLTDSVIDTIEDGKEKLASLHKELETDLDRIREFVKTYA